MPYKVVHIQSLGDVTFSQNARSGSIRLRVKPDQTILVSYPRYVSFTEALRFTEQHADWVIRQKGKNEQRLPNWSEDEPVKTRTFTISFRKHPGKFSVKQVIDQIEILYPEQCKLNDPEILERIQKVLTAIYRLEARKYLPSRLLQLAFTHGFQFGNISIRNNKSNWGSCSGRNNINLNLHLMKMPDHLIDYILLHELAHTRVKNHGPEFWELLNSVTNDQAKLLSKEVRKYSTYSYC